MEIEKKVIRFIELSEKFSKSEREAIGDELGVLNSFKEKEEVSLRYYNDGCSAVYLQSNCEEVRGEEGSLEVLAERMITKIREFEEYKQLQKDLTEYFKAKQKLN